MSTETYYKAVRPDGTDFYSGQVLWDRVGEIVEHPDPGKPGGDDALGLPLSICFPHGLHGHELAVQAVCG